MRRAVLRRGGGCGGEPAVQRRGRRRRRGVQDHHLPEQGEGRARDVLTPEQAEDAEPRVPGFAGRLPHAQQDSPRRRRSTGDGQSLRQRADLPQHRRRGQVRGQHQPGLRDHGRRRGVQPWRHLRRLPGRRPVAAHQHEDAPRDPEASLGSPEREHRGQGQAPGCGAGRDGGAGRYPAHGVRAAAPAAGHRPAQDGCQGMRLRRESSRGIRGGQVQNRGCDSRDDRGPRGAGCRPPGRDGDRPQRQAHPGRGQGARRAEPAIGRAQGDEARGDVRAALRGG